MTDVFGELKKRFGERVKQSEPLGPYTTIKIGGVADYFLVAKTVDELVQAVTAAWERELPYFVLAGGSNVLISDYGFPGLVIKNETSNLVFFDEKSQVIADSGTPLGFLIAQCTSRGLTGLEWASGIPGTVGGAVYGNMAAWGHETSKFVKAVTMLIPLDGQTGESQVSDFTPASVAKIITVRPAWLKARYRTTYLKDERAKGKTRLPVILTVRFQLARKRQDEIIASLRQYQRNRQSRQPLGTRTMGSTFRNPGGFPTPEKMIENKQAAGWYLEQAGAKSFRVGGARVSDKHANFIVNEGGATANDVKSLAEKMQDAVRAKFKVELVEEIEYIGRW